VLYRGAVQHLRPGTPSSSCFFSPSPLHPPLLSCRPCRVAEYLSPTRAPSEATAGAMNDTTSVAAGGANGGGNNGGQGLGGASDGAEGASSGAASEDSKGAAAGVLLSALAVVSGGLMLLVYLRR
jgi:hypothetical protein